MSAAAVLISFTIEQAAHLIAAAEAARAKQLTTMEQDVAIMDASAKHVAAAAEAAKAKPTADTLAADAATAEGMPEPEPRKTAE